MINGKHITDWSLGDKHRFYDFVVNGLRANRFARPNGKQTNYHPGDIYDVLITGSYAGGWLRPDSDIDVCVPCENVFNGCFLAEYDGVIVAIYPRPLKPAMGFALPFYSLRKDAMSNVSPDHIAGYIKRRSELDPEWIIGRKIEMEITNATHD